MSTSSPFIVTSREASEMTSLLSESRRKSSLAGDGNMNNLNDNKSQLACYLLSVRMRPMYGACAVPPGVYKKLPRLVNGIPLGAGVLSHIEPAHIQWKYIEEECNNEVHTFVSQPLARESAEQSRINLMNSLVKHAKAVFGDVTVKVSVTLSQAVTYDSDVIINDIAECLQQGLHFID